MMRLIRRILRLVGLIEEIHHHLKKMLTQADLDAALAELKTAIAAAATRVLDKIAALEANNPDLSTEVADIRTDITALQAIAAPATPAS